MSRLAGSLFVVLALALCAGCGAEIATTFRGRAGGGGAPRDSASVTIYTLRPERPYRIVGYVHARPAGALSNASAPDLISAMQREAAARGCEAIVITHGFCTPLRRVGLLELGGQMEAACASFSSP